MKNLGLVLISVLAILSMSAGPAVAIQTVSSDINRVDTLPMDYYRGYELAGSPVTVDILGPIPEGSVPGKSSGFVPLDFYVFTKSQFADYENPNASQFGYVEQSENATVFHAELTQPNLILVVDNAYISTSGASPVANVTYQIVIAFAASGLGGVPLTFIAVGIGGSAVAVAVGVAVWRRKRMLTQTTGTAPSVPQAPPVTTP